MHRRQLPLAYECRRDVAAMPARGEGRERWCDGCEKSVHDLSMYSETEARALMRESGGQLCIAYRADARGEVQFRRTMLDRLGMALASAALLLSAGCIRPVDMKVESPVFDDEDPEALQLGVTATVGVLGRLPPSAFEFQVAPIERRFMFRRMADAGRDAP